jgi:hypothetical protein
MRKSDVAPRPDGDEVTLAGKMQLQVTSPASSRMTKSAQDHFA